MNDIDQPIAFIDRGIYNEEAGRDVYKKDMETIAQRYTFVTVERNFAF